MNTNLPYSFSVIYIIVLFLGHWNVSMLNRNGIDWNFNFSHPTAFH